MKNFLLIVLFLFAFASCREAINNNNPITPTNSPPDVPSNPNPADNASNIGRFITVSWLGGDPDASDTVKYDVIMGTVNPPITVVESNTTATIVDVGLVAANTVFYWKVIAKDNHNSFTESPIWKFTTGN
ncbi:MAG TPA: hypothetical protein VHP32_05195 [Ignavibacteria bacterium]|nr:hypothetical protein [Ignavibacteria bacterium]